MKLIETRIDVDATAQEVWDVLMDFGSYPSWNPMVVAIDGRPEIGETLRVTVAMQGGRRMQFRPVVVEHEHGRRLGWSGKLWIPGIFDGLHRFEVEDRGAHATFVHSEEFRGILPVLAPWIIRDTHGSVEAMNAALAEEVVRRRAQRAPAAAPIEA